MFQMDIMGILQLYFGFAAGIAALQPSRQRHARSWASASSLACLLVVRDLWTSHHHSISWLRCFFPRKPHLCWKSSITLLYQALLSAGGAGGVIDLKSSSSWPQEREQTWRQQCQSKVSAKKSIMVMPLDSSVAHGVCCHLPGDSVLGCSMCRLWDKVTPDTYTGITWSSGLSLHIFILLLLASGLVASAATIPPGEGCLMPPPLGVTPVRFWGLCH